MKIGIMSMQRVVNYGSYLQAYGLKKTLESFGHTVEFVDYKVEPALVKNTVQTKNAMVSKVARAIRLLSPSYRKWRENQIKANQIFLNFYNVFVNNFIPELGVSEYRNELPKLELLVIGSDEVFNCTQSSELVGYSRQLFGADCRAKKLITYAACFGSTTLEKLEMHEIKDEVGNYLKKFDALSVRDENSFELIKALCGVQAQRHIDPVLLYDFPEVDEIPVDLENYIVVYAYSERISDDEATWIKKFARKKGMKLISLGFWQTFCDDYVLTTPLETLAYIRKANYVITDTFHGSVFSIKYQKNFATIVRKSNQKKLEDLLKQFELENHQIRNLMEMEQVLEQTINKNKISESIREKQKNAKEYLLYEISNQ